MPIPADFRWLSHDKTRTSTRKLQLSKLRAALILASSKSKSCANTCKLQVKDLRPDLQAPSHKDIPFNYELQVSETRHSFSSSKSQSQATQLRTLSHRAAPSIRELQVTELRHSVAGSKLSVAPIVVDIKSKHPHQLTWAPSTRAAPILADLKSKAHTKSNS